MSHVEPVPHMLNALQHLCIPHLLQDQATRIPNAPAILAPGRTPLTYWRLHRQVDDTVETLHTRTRSPRPDCSCVTQWARDGCRPACRSGWDDLCSLNPGHSTDEFDFYLTKLRAQALIIQTDMDSPARAVAQARGLPLIELSPIREAEAGIFTLAGRAQRRHIQPGFATLTM